MADEKQLAILKQGVEAWNTWKRKHATKYTDLKDTDLSDLNLAGILLPQANLAGARLGKTSPAL